MILGRLKPAGFLFPGRKTHKRKAFTLLELMMAVAIVGILSAIAYPSLSRLYYIYLLDGNATNLATDMRFVLNESISHKEMGQRISDTEVVYFPVCYGIEFETNNSYQLWRYYKPSGTWVRHAKIADNKSTIFSGGVQIHSSSWPLLVNFIDVDKPVYRIIFNNNGVPTSDGATQLTQQQRTILLYSSFCGLSRRITIDLNTGKPRVEQ